LDERYRKNFGMSMIENLNTIKSRGIREFLVKQREKYKCPKCGGVICIHNRKCFDCEKNRKLEGLNLLY
jgi:transposase